MNAISLPQRRLGADALQDAAVWLRRIMPARRMLLVCDDLTWQAAGEMLRSQFPANMLDVHSLGKRVAASGAIADELALRAKDYEALLAVGSGTVNDLTKFAASASNKPYCVVATAASMNGYTSANASLEVNGLKQSFAARPPLAVIADRAVLTAAPKRLTRAGIGDTLCRTTVEADMRMSHHLLGTTYPREIFDRLRTHEPLLLTGLMNARDDESAFIMKLMETLLDAGDAMSAYGSSAVASQGEHMIAHTLELKYGAELKHLLHGELIAVTSLSMSQFQQRMLLSTPVVKPMPYRAEQFERLFGKAQASAMIAAYGRKLLSEEQAKDINARLETSWPQVVESLKEIMLATNTLERALIHSGINVTPQQIGLADERYRFATSYAHLTRERFTFLDLAAMNVQRLR